MITMNDKSLHTQMFDADYLRLELARRGDMVALEETYNGSCPEIEISTSSKWDDIAKMSTVPEIRIRRLTRVAELVSTGAGLLDVGPGWGDIIPILEKQHSDLNYTGIDFSANVINRLSEKFPGHRFICGQISEVEEEGFDAILVLEVLEHIVPSQVLGFLRQVRERLKPNGELMITIPIGENIEESTFVCGSCGQPMNKMGHVRIYSAELIKAELKLAGFSVKEEELMYIGYYGLKGTIKRHLRNTIGKLLGPSDFRPAKSACVILKCVKAPA